MFVHNHPFLQLKPFHTFFLQKFPKFNFPSIINICIPSSSTVILSIGMTLPKRRNTTKSVGKRKFNTKEGRTPSARRECRAVPNGPAKCSIYRPIRLLSHTMKIFERIFGNRNRNVVEISVNQIGFVENCETIDIIDAARLL